LKSLGDLVEATNFCVARKGRQVSLGKEKLVREERSVEIDIKMT
jgi:hypothetical protein